MKWYNEEANKQNAIDRDDANRRDVIQSSDWWAKLRRQVEEDVKGINEPQGFWAQRLGRWPLLVIGHYDGSSAYVIRKELVPGLLITVRLIEPHTAVEITHDLYEDPMAPTTTSERLRVDCKDREVYLVTENDSWLQVPEVAARHILMPIIEMLKTVKPLTGV